MQANSQQPQKLRIPEKYKSDLTFIRSKFIEIAEDESQNFSIGAFPPIKTPTKGTDSRRC